jgi:hypothetical protein
MKSKFFTSIAFGLFLAASLVAPHANAQFVVDAPTADAELVTANVSLGAQVVSAAKTAASTTEALGVAKDTFDAIGSGITAFGNQVFQADDSLPDAKGTLNLMNSTGAASDIARAAQKDASSLGEPYFAKVSKTVTGGLDADMNSAASSMAANQDVFANAKLHTAALEKLRLSLTTTTNLKQTADLQARIQLETADITNELVKVQALENMEEHNDKVREIQTKQKMFGRNSKSY